MSDPSRYDEFGFYAPLPVDGGNRGQTFRPGRRLEAPCPPFACRTSRVSSWTFASIAAAAAQLLCSTDPPIGDRLV